MHLLKHLESSVGADGPKHGTSQRAFTLQDNPDGPEDLFVGVDCLFQICLHSSCG